MQKLVYTVAAVAALGLSSTAWAASAGNNNGDINQGYNNNSTHSNSTQKGFNDNSVHKSDSSHSGNTSNAGNTDSSNSGNTTSYSVPIDLKFSSTTTNETANASTSLSGSVHNNGAESSNEAEGGWAVMHNEGPGTLRHASSGNGISGTAYASASARAGSFSVSNRIGSGASYNAGIVTVAQNSGANSLVQQGTTVQGNVAR